MQAVILTFDDGTKASFVGKVALEEDDTKSNVKIAFTVPKEMPEDCKFEAIN